MPLDGSAAQKTRSADCSIPSSRQIDVPAPRHPVAAIASQIAGLDSTAPNNQPFAAASTPSAESKKSSCYNSLRQAVFSEMHCRRSAASAENLSPPAAKPAARTQNSTQVTDSAPQIPKSGRTRSNTRVHKLSILTRLHTPVFCRSASHSFIRPCALLEKHRGCTPIVPKSELARFAVAYLRRSLGVASQRRWPLGGERRLSSRAATPAFLSWVT
jgi:hypothetical protein